MTQLRFHHDVYSTVALDEAIEVFKDHGELTRSEKLPYYEVEVSAPEGTDEAELAGEFGNYVLALTVEEKREA